MKCHPIAVVSQLGMKVNQLKIEAKPGQKHVTEVVCVVLLAIEYRLEKIWNC